MTDPDLGVVGSDVPGVVEPGILAGVPGVPGVAGVAGVPGVSNPEAEWNVSP